MRREAEDGVRRETGPPVPFRVEPSFDQALARLAARQHGAFSLAQLVSAGMTESGVRKRVGHGQLHRVHRSVYSLVPKSLLSRKGRYMAAVLACGERAALSHRSAGALLGLIGWNAATVDISVPTAGGRGRRKGIAVHRSTTLRRSDVTRVHGIPCTCVARTLLDLAGVLDRRGVERALDQAEILHVLDVRALRDQIVQNAGRPAASRLQAVIEEHLIGSTPTWNAIEERMLALIGRLGLPKPEVQQYVNLHDGEPMIRADFLWRAQRVIVETDGWWSHGTRTAFEGDRHRDQRALAQRWQPVRATWRQLSWGDPTLERALLAAVTGSPAPAAG